MPIGFTSLAQWLKWQETLHPAAIDLTLERVSRVHKAMGSPKPAPVVVTVGGTNGKGSCVAMLESILRAGGYRVGTYSSPHLLKYNERIRIEGTEATDEAIIRAFEVIDSVREEISLTYFEFGTLAALYLFGQQTLDAVILEVGLGGRLDATNIVDADLALISSVGLDHQQWLGRDREAIGYEKAGIFRSGCPAVYGDPQPPDSVLRAARQRGTKLFRLGEDYGYEMSTSDWHWTFAQDRLENLPSPGLAGGQQYQNASAVLMALRALAAILPVDTAAIRQGLAAVTLPGRYQRMAERPEVVLDVAHNPDAFQMLAMTLKTQPSRVTRIVLGVLEDKAIGDMLPLLAPHIDYWHLASPDTPRGLSVDRLKAAVKSVSQKPVFVYTSVTDAFTAARSAAGDNERILVTGSFFTVAEIMARYYPEGL
ncbi:MAG TPA: bifunctional tetrahydrofolate synthase/dihydrofolate synthase [Gammaproteobacteria bacterium]